MSRRRTLSRFLATLAATASVLATAGVAPASAAPPSRATDKRAAAPAGDTAWYATEPEALAAARATGARIEVDGLTTETRQVFANPQGTFTLEQRARPVRLKRDGAWVPVDTTLVFDKTGRVAPR